MLVVQRFLNKLLDHDILAVQVVGLVIVFKSFLHLTHLVERKADRRQRARDLWRNGQGCLIVLDGPCEFPILFK